MKLKMESNKMASKQKRNNLKKLKKINNLKIDLQEVYSNFRFSGEIFEFMEMR